MNVLKLIAAFSVFVAGGAFAADGAPAAVAGAAVGVSPAAVQESNPAAPDTRAQVQAEAVEFVSNYKTTLQAQLEQYRN